MKTTLILEVKFRDDKVVEYECTDFPSFAPDFITLYREGFVVERIRTETVERVVQYFKHYQVTDISMAKAKAKAKAAKATKATKKTSKK